MNEKEYYISRMSHLHVDDKVREHLLERTEKEHRGIYGIYKKTGMAAVLAVLALFIVPSPVQSKAQEYCRLVVYHINDFLWGEKADVTDYTTSPIQADKDGNLALQLNEVLIDGDHMIFNYTVTCDDPVFYFNKEANGGTYEGYYDIALERITINDKTKKYKDVGENPGNLSGFVCESEDHYSYPVEDEYCMHEFADILKGDPDKPLKVWMDVAAVGSDDDVRHFSFAFDVTNRELQLETKEIPIDYQVKVDDVNLTMDKMVINSNSHKVYFYIDGVKDFAYNNTSGGMDDHRYEFGLSGADDKGNEVRAEVKEIIDGYGYFELVSWDDNVALNKDVGYYDLRINYSWHDPKGDVVDDGYGIGDEESVYYGVDGVLGDVFRVNCE